MKKFQLSICAIILMLLVLVNISLNSQVIQAEELKINNISSAKSYIVMDDNGVVLIENNADEKREVASICKLMTTLITLENIENGNISLDSKFGASDYACLAEGSQAFLDVGCEYTVRDLLKSVIVASANDSAIVLAENIAGSESAFVEKMNAKAENLGMKNTRYINSTGLHDKNKQFSTARDTAIILNEISNFDIYREDCKIWMDTLIHPSGRETELVNTNRLIRYYDYCDTGKTGYTDEAGYCLSSTASKDNLKLTCVVLGCASSADRFSDSIAIYNYVFANYRNEKIIDKNAVVDKNVVISKGKKELLNVAFENDYYLTRKIGDKVEYEIKYVLPKNLVAPIEKNSVIGHVDIVIGNDVLGSVNILAVENIEKQNYKDTIEKIIEKFATIR